MIHLSSTELAKILSIPAPIAAFQFSGISTDTRTLQPGNLFIAIMGENGIDGAAYLDEAKSKGAVAALVHETTASSLPQLAVTDTLKAFGHLAREWRLHFKLPLIGLTGSNGKTTLKNLTTSILCAACQDEAQVLATEGNFNNHLGVPMMLSRLNDKQHYAVIEMGMNHFGELNYLTSLAQPTIAIINNAAPAHLAGVGNSIEGVAKAKGEIFSGLAADGTAILNADDQFYSYWKGLIGDRASYSFGMGSNADVHALVHASKDPLKQSITIVTPRDRIDVLLPLLGKHNVMNALAATAACVALNISADAIKHGLEAIQPAKGRLQMHQLAQGIRLIDDTYNANPASLTAAINVLAAFEGPKVLILGDMVELGDNSSDLHANMGRLIKEAGIQQLYTCGELSAEISKNFGANAHHFKEQSSLVDAMRGQVAPQSTLLVKGSRKMKMEKVVEAVKEVLA